ncbi:NADPH:quinone oxidoreductase family protein [Nocardioides marmoriginsengisoli]|uniref:NADPH:quinone oxidoreductase family protein n=1 Tax=Nocardioides marmoriginsengisoli TaxID=661483 RepID=A0A3N0CHB4_9ACTN|nr:zinc-binding dehydrogenase [Nocardioides marmoriginsengisoli]RNL62818.1 NADPH:quinone oxidoreductase family protein [Nocardioides marmoriginsengisoli]
MRAALVKEFGPPSSLVVERVADLTPGPGEVAIEVAAVSVNFPDVLVVEGTYQNLPPLPFSPGKEAAGRGTAVGAGVERVWVGDSVLAIIEHGGYAEQVVAPEGWVVHLPDSVSYTDAAGAGLVYCTAHLGLFRRGRLQVGETALIKGAGGGVGTAGVQLAKAVGTRVIAVAKDEARAAVARSFGAEVVLTSKPESLRADVLSANDGQGVDVCLESLGGDYRDRLPEVMRSATDGVLDLMADCSLDAAVSHVLPLNRAGEALQKVSDGGVCGKVVLTTGLG